jgi:ribosomal protein S8
MKKGIMAKDEYIGFRTSKEIKQILQDLADEGYRTLSQQCEMAVIQWLFEQGYLKGKPKKNP